MYWPRKVAGEIIPVLLATRICHRQTYQNYEQSQQELGTFLENEVFWKQNFEKKIFIKVSLLVQCQWKLFSERFYKFLTLKNYLENQKFEMFEEVVHNFGSLMGTLL